MSDDAARARSDDLAAAVVRTRRALEALQAGVVPGRSARRRSLQPQLELQITGLRRMERALGDGALPRHVWSLGQAAMPVLPTLITRLGADGTDAVEPLLAEAHAAVAGLGAELTRFAEGR